MATPNMDDVVKGFADDLKKMNDQESNKTTKIKFTCPICGSKKYEEEYKVIEPEKFGRPEWTTPETIGYHCAGCSVKFGDPALFSKKTESAPK